MTTLIVGNYSISTEKVDVTTNKLAEIVGEASIVAALISFMAMIILLIARTATMEFPEFEKPLLNLVLALLAICIICLIALFASVIFGRSGCGVRVSFYEGSTRVSSTDHAFTTVPNRDAEKIQHIIDGYTERAKVLMGEKEKKKAEESKKKFKKESEQEKCCTQYKTVMEIVNWRNKQP